MTRAARFSQADRPYSPETLADRWSCSSETVRQMCRRGDLSYFRLGKLIRIPANEVERVECLNGGSSSTEDSGASPTEIPASELRLARMIGDGPKLSLVKYGDGSTDQRRNG
jgi:excisionase family DNA binding protein